MILQLFCLAGFAWASFRLLVVSVGLTARDAGISVCMLLLSWVTAKFIAMPLSEYPFSFLSALALLALHFGERARAGRRLVLLLTAVLLIGASILTRTVGVALVPVFLWSAAQGLRQRAGTAVALLIRRPLALTAVLLVVLLVGLGASQTTYFAEAMQVYGDRGGAAAAWYVLAGHLREFGELALNVPHTRVPASLAWFQWLFIAIGAVVAVAVLRAIWRRRAVLGVVDIYVLCYMAVLFAWPYSDARFWVPVLPFLAGLALPPLLRPRRSPGRWSPGRRWLVRAYLVSFCLLGAVALAFTTRLTLSGRAFPTRYGNAATQATYREAYRLPRVGDEEHDPVAVRLLRRYDHRCRQDGDQ